MTPEQNRKIVVVLGAGRSGTSLMMQALKEFGLSISPNLISPRAHNIRGPMEDADIANVYEDVLLQIGSSRVLPLELDRISEDVKRQAQRKLKNIVHDNISASKNIWGFKDPFTSCLLPIWFRVFNQTQTIPTFILVVRNPAHAVISRKKHFGIPESIGELAWLVNYTEALHHTGGDCYIAHYEDWFTDGEKLAEELLEYTGLEEFLEGKTVDEVLGIVVKDNLNRSIYNEHEIQNEFVDKLYKALKKCRGRDFDRAEIMETIKECHKAMGNFRGWYLYAQQMAQQHKGQIRGQETIDKMKIDLEHLVLENNRLLIENKQLIEEMNNYRMGAATNNSVNKRQLQNWKREAIVLKHSYSYRLGQILINAFKQPGKKTLLMPYYIVKLILDIILGRGRDQLRNALERIS